MIGTRSFTAITYINFTRFNQLTRASIAVAVVSDRVQVIVLRRLSSGVFRPVTLNPTLHTGLLVKEPQHFVPFV